MVQIKSEKLLDALKSVASAAAPPKSKQDEVRLVLHDKFLRVEASSGSWRTEVSLRPTKKTGSLDRIVPYRALAKLIQAAGEEIEISLEKEDLLLKSGRRTLRLHSKDGSAWRGSPEFRKSRPLAEVPGKQLGKMLPLASRCASEDSGRPIISTVAWSVRKNDLCLVATDSYRLTCLPLESQPEEALLSPRLMPLFVAKSLAKDIKRKRPPIIEIRVWEEEDSEGLYITYENVEWSIACREGKYPEWEDLLPRQGDAFFIDRDELEETLEGVEAIGGGNKKPDTQNAIGAMRLILEDDVKIVFKRPGVGVLEESLPGSSWSGEKLEIGLNPTFLKDMIYILSEGPLSAYVKDSATGVVWKDETDNLYLSMPVRLPPEMEEI